MTIDRTFTIVGASNPYPCAVTSSLFTGNNRSKVGEFLHYTIPEDNRYDDHPRASMVFNHYLSQPVGGEVPGDEDCVQFATYGDAPMRDTGDVFPSIIIRQTGHYRFSNHMRFNQKSDGDQVLIQTPELLCTLSNYKNAPDKNAPIPADHLTLFRNVRLCDDEEAVFLTISDRQMNYEFDVSPQLLEANGGAIALAYMIGFRDDGSILTSLTEPDVRKGALGVISLHGLDYLEQDETLPTPMAPELDFLWDANPTITPYPGGRGINRNEKEMGRVNGCNFILQWVSKHQDPTDNGVTGDPPADESKPIFPTTFV
jgi:hypothetical protein